MNKIDGLIKHIAEGEEQANRGEFIEDFAMDTLIEKLDKESQKQTALKAETLKEFFECKKRPSDNFMENHVQEEPQKREL